MVRDGSFREDLLYRIQSVRIHLPPLRERNNDITLLGRHFLEEICDRTGHPLKSGSKDFFEVLGDYDWPGNIRELINTLEHAVGAAGSSHLLYAQHLPPLVRAKVARARVSGPSEKAPPKEPQTTDPLPEDIPPLQKYRDTICARAERNYLQQLLQSTGANMKEAMRISGLSQSRLYALLKKHGLQKR
jgi:two-component system NtrC family response regulator